MPPSIRPTSPCAVDALALQDLEAAGGGGGTDCIGGALSCGRRSSFSYHRLPDPRLRLTVRKLDGSFFGNPPDCPFFYIHFPQFLGGIGDF